MKQPASEEVDENSIIQHGKNRESNRSFSPLKVLPLQTNKINFPTSSSSE